LEAFGSFEVDGRGWRRSDGFLLTGVGRGVYVRVRPKAAAGGIEAAAGQVGRGLEGATGEELSPMLPADVDILTLCAVLAIVGLVPLAHPPTSEPKHTPVFLALAKSLGLKESVPVLRDGKPRVRDGDGSGVVTAQFQRMIHHHVLEFRRVGWFVSVLSTAIDVPQLPEGLPVCFDQLRVNVDVEALGPRGTPLELVLNA
jgi:hypothetical protein